MVTVGSGTRFPNITLRSRAKKTQSTLSTLVESQNIWSIPRPHLVGPSQRPPLLPPAVWRLQHLSGSPQSPVFPFQAKSPILPLPHLPHTWNKCPQVTVCRPVHSTTTRPLSHFHHRIKAGNSAIGLSEVVLLEIKKKVVTALVGPKTRHLHHLEQRESSSTTPMRQILWYPRMASVNSHSRGTHIGRSCSEPMPCFWTFCPSFQWACHSLKLTLILTSCSAPSSEVLNSEANPRQVNNLMQHLGFTCSTDTQHTSTKVSRLKLPSSRHCCRASCVILAGSCSISSATPSVSRLKRFLANFPTSPTRAGL